MSKSRNGLLGVSFRQLWTQTRLRKVGLWISGVSVLALNALAVVGFLPGLEFFQGLTTSCSTTTTTTVSTIGNQPRSTIQELTVKACQRVDPWPSYIAIGAAPAAVILIEMTSLGLRFRVKVRDALDLKVAAQDRYDRVVEMAKKLKP